MKVHEKITRKWITWDAAGGLSNADDVRKYAKEIDEHYKEFWYKE